MFGATLEQKAARSNTSNVSAPKQIDKSKLKKLIIDAFDATREAKDRDVILVIGSTGSGKSTTINYLLGSKMENTRAPKTGKPCVVVKAGDKEHAKIGHNVTSQTLYPELFVPNDAPFSYCDCPGFEDNRGPEYPICAAIATKVAINAVKSVKAIVVVIEQNAFLNQRGRGFVSVFKTLQELLTNRESAEGVLKAEDLAKSLIFLVTRHDPNVNNIELVREFKESADQEFSKAGKPDDATMSFMCGLILQNENNIINVNPVDNGESRNAIIDTLLLAKPIAKERFGFPAEANTKRELRDLMSQIAASGIRILRDLEERPAEITRKIAAKITEEKIIADCNEKLEKLSKPGPVSADSLDMIKQSIKDNQARIKENKKEIKRLTTNKNTLTARLRLLDSSDQVQYWEDSFDEQRTFGVVKKGIINTKQFKYSGIAFEKAYYSCSGEGSTFSDEANNPGSGNFGITFSTGKDQYGNASVSIYVQKRNRPDNVRDIASTRSEITDTNTAIANLETAIKTGIDLDAELQKGLVRVISSAEDNKKLLIQAVSRDKSDAQERLRVLIADLITATNALAKAQRDILEEHSAFELVKKIVPVIGKLESATVTEFLALCEKLSSLIEKTIKEAGAIKAEWQQQQGALDDLLKKLKEKPEEYKGFSYNKEKPLLEAKLADGQTKLFEEFEAKSDGNCGFYVLGIKRKEAVKILSALSDNVAAREDLAPEIINAVKSNDLGGAATDNSRALHKLYTELQAAQNALEIEANNLICKTNPKFSRKGLNGLLEYFNTIKDPSYSAIQDRLTKQKAAAAQCEDDIKTYCSSKEMYVNYVRSLERETSWLGYKSAKLLAQQKHFNLYIWQKTNPTSTQLKLGENYEDPHPRAAYHMLHTNGFTHFNLLAEAAAPQQTAAAAPAGYDPRIMSSARAAVPQNRQTATRSDNPAAPGLGL